MNRTDRTTNGGFALILVVIALAMTVVLGLAYLASASMYRICADNFVQIDQTRYLAESGVEHGVYLLQEHPADISNTAATTFGPFTLDSTGQSYSLSIVPTGVRGRYRIDATASIGRCVQPSQALVQCGPIIQNVHVSQALLVGASTVTSPWLTVKGDVHVNGTLWNYGRIDGSATATGTVVNCGRISQSIGSGAAQVTVPAVVASDYYDYRYNGKPAHAAWLQTSYLDGRTDLRAGRIDTPNNPAGVIAVKPSSTSRALRLGDGFTIEGTLVVQGDVILDGDHINFNPAGGFPALIVTGRLFITGRCRARLYGMVVSPFGVLPMGDTSHSKTEFVGALVCRYAGLSSVLMGRQEIRYDDKKATLTDVAMIGQPGQPVHVLSWQE